MRSINMMTLQEVQKAIAKQARDRGLERNLSQQTLSKNRASVVAGKMRC